MKIIRLFFEIDITGHHSEYIGHLIDYLSSKKLDERIVFVVHPDFIVRFPDIVNKAKPAMNIQIIEITNNEYRKTKRGSLIIQSIRIFRLMNRYANKNNVQRVYLLSLNSFQFALGLFRSKYEISGILFGQFYRSQKVNLKDKVKYYRKYWQTWFFSKNKNIKQVFILNDVSTAEYLNKEFKTNIFKMLPDPVPELSPLPGFSIRRSFQIGKKRKIFLHFGSLSERKGTLDILDALNNFDENDINKIALLFIGKASVSIDGAIQNKIHLLRKRFPLACLIYRNEFINESLMKSYFDQCDCILVPYKNVESSSGIIGHTIAAGKPVIATDKGLLGELVRNNNLGLLIEESSPMAISEGIRWYINNSFPVVRNQDYMISHSTQCYAKIFTDL